jgi:type II secretory ATPase GspE/PulE/Tfp pilus assembly ATPase PilB-like protein
VTQTTNTLEDIKNLITKEKVGESFYRSEFHTILDDVKMALDRQDSDNALNTLIRGAIGLRASDVHLEIHEHDSMPRLRIDGNLASLGILSLKEHQALVERLKYRSNLKLNIHNVPQDGKFRLGKLEKDSHIDVRVSVMPTRYGESVVCRILDATNNVLTVDALGIIGPQKTVLLDSLQKKQ